MNGVLGTLNPEHDEYSLIDSNFGFFEHKIKFNTLTTSQKALEEKSYFIRYFLIGVLGVTAIGIFILMIYCYFRNGKNTFQNDLITINWINLLIFS